MKWLAVTLVAILAAPAYGQPTLLYSGRFDLALRDGDAVVECLSLVDPNPDPDAERIDTTGMTCVRPGAQGTEASLQHYVQSLTAAGFKHRPSSALGPVFMFCRDKELMVLGMMLPNVMMNTDLEWVDESGRPTSLEAEMEKAPIVMTYKPEGPCS